jgi:hypothetical protein
MRTLRAVVLTRVKRPSLVVSCLGLALLSTCTCDEAGPETSPPSPAPVPTPVATPAQEAPPVQRAAPSEDEARDQLRRIGVAVREGRAAANAERWDEAIAAFERAVAIDPARADVRCELGFVLYRAQQIDRAVVEIDRALRDRRAFARREALGACLYNRGRIAEDRREATAAATFYRASLAERPNDTVAARLTALPTAAGAAPELDALIEPGGPSADANPWLSYPECCGPYPDRETLRRAMARAWCEDDWLEGGPGTSRDEWFSPERCAAAAEVTEREQSFAGGTIVLSTWYKAFAAVPFVAFRAPTGWLLGGGYDLYEPIGAGTVREFFLWNAVEIPIPGGGHALRLETSASEWTMDYDADGEASGEGFEGQPEYHVFFVEDSDREAESAAGDPERYSLEHAGAPIVCEGDGWEEHVELGDDTITIGKVDGDVACAGDETD